LRAKELDDPRRQQHDSDELRNRIREVEQRVCGDEIPFGDEGRDRGRLGWPEELTDADKEEVDDVHDVERARVEEITQHHPGAQEVRDDQDRFLVAPIDNDPGQQTQQDARNDRREHGHAQVNARLADLLDDDDHTEEDRLLSGLGEKLSQPEESELAVLQDVASRGGFERCLHAILPAVVPPGFPRRATRRS